MAQGDGKRDGEGDDGLPEVEAELVDETASSSGAFDADADPAPPTEKDGAPDGAESETDDAIADETAEPEGRKSTLTPGVMLFLAFAVVALAAFGVWRLQSGPKPEPQASAPVAGVADGQGAVAEAETSVPSEPAEASTRSSNGAENDDPDKIANIENGVKPDATLGEPRPTDGSFLPPVPEAGAAKLSNSVEAGAKEAMRRFREAEDAEQAPAGMNQQAPERPVDRFELENKEALGETPSSTDRKTSVEPSLEETSSAADASSSTADSVVSPENTDSSASAAEASDASRSASPEGAETRAETDERAIADSETDSRAELAALRQVFATEKAQLENALAEARQRNEVLLAEIQMLREESAAAINARDEAVRAANAELSTLRADVEKIRKEQAKTSDRQMNAAFALTALARAIDQGAPYQSELAAVEEFDPAASAALGAHAQRGVVTEALLRERFDAAARAAHAAAGQEKASGWGAALTARAKSLINVRPARPVSGDGAGAVLSRAEHALEEGDVGLAVQQLEALPPSAKAAMAQWISDAQSRAAVEAALSSLQARLAGEAG